MTQTYRTTDMGKWGVGKGSDLTATEVDVNFWDALARIVILEALPGAAAGIDFFAVSGTQFYVHMTDATVLGPYTLPVATFNDRGTWQPTTSYAVLDTFTINGGMYYVLYAHTSGASFDAGANDGLGHDYYKLMVQPPGTALPTGGAVGQILQKSTIVDYALTYGWKYPSGGTARQYLIQQSVTQDDAAWDTPTASDIEFVPVTGSTLTSTLVSDALEELSTAVGAGSAASVSAPAVDGTPGQLLATVDGTSADTEWVDAGGAARFGTATALGNSGSLTLDPALGDVFTTSPTGNISIATASAPIGSHIVLVITTADANGYTVTLNANFIPFGNIKLPKHSGESVIITFAGDGTYLYETSRTFCPPDARVMSGTTITVFPAFGLTYTLTPTGDSTIAALYAPVDQILKVIFTTSGTSSYNITFTTNMKSQGVLATGVTSGKVFVVTFVGDGTNFNEISRTTAM